MNFECYFSKKSLDVNGLVTAFEIDSDLSKLFQVRVYLGNKEKGMIKIDERLLCVRF